MHHLLSHEWCGWLVVHFKPFWKEISHIWHVIWRLHVQKLIYWYVMWIFERYLWLKIIKRILLQKEAVKGHLSVTKTDTDSTEPLNFLHRGSKSLSFWGIFLCCSVKKSLETETHSYSTRNIYHKFNKSWKCRGEVQSLSSFLEHVVSWLLFLLVIRLGKVWNWMYS